MGVGIQVNFVKLIPTAPTDVPSGSYFIDSTNGNAAAIKNVVGVVVTVENPAASLTTKQMQASGPIGIKKSVSKRPDGKIHSADTINSPNQNICGVALSAAIADGDLVNVLLVGANLVGALIGLGFTPGQEVYLNSDGGYTNDPSTVSNPELLIKIGVADNPAGPASPTVEDLILFPEVVSSP